MCGAVESNKCSVCGQVGIVNRTYYYYPIKCNCCNNKDDTHFEIVYTCEDCIPKPTRVIKVVIEPISKR